ncbi:MAG: LuxR C-terminal-related transcriptional regulator, partial [Dehalococcoidia bacterium]
GERYQFSHALVQETLAEELSTSRKARLHARIGEALEDLYGAGAEAHASELAYHFGKAEPILGAKGLVRYSLLAGEQALATYAWEEGLVHFERGLEAKKGQPMDAEAAALWFGLGRAQAATLERHQLGEAIASLSQAFDYYIEVGDMTRAVAIAESTARPGPGQSIGVADFVVRALVLVPPDSREAGYLLSRHGTIMARVEGDYQGAQHAFGQALAIAQRDGDVALEMQTLVESASTDSAHLRYRESLEKSLKAVELARRTDEPRVEVSARYYAGNMLHRIGDREGSRRHAVATLALAERLRDRFWLTNALVMNEYTRRLEGDWHAARTFSDRGLAEGSQDSRLLGNRAQLEYQVGEFSQGEVYLDRLLEVMRQTQPGPTLEFAVLAAVIPIVARITGVLDRLDVAETAAETVLSSPSAIPLSLIVARSGLALLAVLRSDAVVAEEQYSSLKSNRGTMLPPMVSIAADRLLGLLSQIKGEQEEAMAHFQDALAFCRKAGYRPELAWSCCDYANCLLQRNNFGAHEKAKPLLDESLAISAELGMTPLMERVVGLQEKAESQPVPAPTYPASLTQREVEVLRLIALGKSNREIAEELTISLNTVLRHVSHILAKTGAANRVEAATFASRQGLV